MTLPANTHWIDRLLAVGGACTAADAPGLRDGGVLGLIDLRAEAAHDRRAFAPFGITVLHLPTPDTFGPALRDMEQGVAFARAITRRDGKLLIHCTHGIGRSATLALAVMVDGGYAPLDALRLMKTQREAVSLSASQFDAWVAWLHRAKRRTGATWPIPSFDDITPIIWRQRVAAQKHTSDRNPGNAP